MSKKPTELLDPGGTIARRYQIQDRDQDVGLMFARQ
jgi:hypothetical protein